MTGAAVVGVVLAGGRGRRFGGDKPASPVAGVPMLRRVVEALRPAVDETAVVGPASPPGEDGNAAGLPGMEGLPGTAWLRDATPDLGPVEGLRVGLTWARERGAGTVVVLASDLPLLDGGVIEALLKAWRRESSRDDIHALIPVVGGRLQPLAAVYSPRALERVVSLLRPSAGSRDASLHGVVAGLAVRSLTPEELAVPAERFLNVNTAAQRDRAERIIRDRGRRGP